MPAAQGKLDSGIDVKRLFDVVDFANIMTYDLTGAWSDTSGHHSALYGNPADPNYDEGFSVDQTVEYLREKGAASEKIVIEQHSILVDGTKWQKGIMKRHRDYSKSRIIKSRCRSNTKLRSENKTH